MPNIRKRAISSLPDARISRCILEHWNEIKGGNKFPAEKDLHVELLEDIFGSCFLLDVKGVDEGRYHYKFLGENIVKAFGCKTTKKLDYNKNCPFSYKNNVADILKTGKPLTSSGEFKNVHGDLVKYRQCLVPMSNDGKNIISILGGMSYKVIKQHE